MDAAALKKYCERSLSGVKPGALESTKQRLVDKVVEAARDDGEEVCKNLVDGRHLEFGNETALPGRESSNRRVVFLASSNRPQGNRLD